jgi:hypothetical protein
VTDSTGSGERCPTCGAPVEVVTADEGTSYYREAGSGERDASVPLAGRVAAVETYLERLRAIGDQTECEEVITRRVLWALRGSHDDPSHPDRVEAKT